MGAYLILGPLLSSELSVKELNLKPIFGAELMLWLLHARLVQKIWGGGVGVGTYSNKYSNQNSIIQNNKILRRTTMMQNK